MHLDDISDFLARIKEAEEIGLTPAEVWRSPDGSRIEVKGSAEDRFTSSPYAQTYRIDLERCARCKRETAPENGYRTGAGFFCAPCSSEYNDSSVR